MKNIIIGTAGHIDHGKTTLIKAITGRETDRLKEEKDRGISIELGFTYFDLPSGRRAGLIDVPGHEKFIKNMLAGVNGMDIVILVVAADEGMMPQTIEHLNILNLLNIKKGIIALTKTDLVDNEWLQLVKDDIKENIKDTFLENSSLIEVSSIKKTGINKLINEVDELTKEVGERNIDEIPRLPVDRVFTLTGFGTIVTGTLIEGTFNVGDEIEVFPGNKKSRIRSIQVHGKGAEKAFAGQRVAINLAGLKKSEVNKGDTIAPVDSMKDTMMLDVKLNLLKNSPWIIENRTRLRLYLGTQEVLCRAVLLDKEYLTPGESCYAQLRLEEKTVSKINDKFIIRFYSPMTTIGGGTILDSNPIKKKRFQDDIIEELKAKETGDSIKILEELVKEKSKEFPTLNQLSVELVTTEKKVKNMIEKLIEEGSIIKFTLASDEHFIHKSYFNKIRDNIIEDLKKYHENNPLKIGVLREELRSRYFNYTKPKIGEAFIDYLLNEEIITQTNLYISLTSFEVKYNDRQLKIKEDIEKKFLSDKFSPPKEQDIINNLNYSKEEIKKVFDSLIQRKKLILVEEEIIFHKDAYNEALKRLKEYLNKNEFITLAEFRDILNTSRKYAMALIEDFDRNKITKRIEDKRKLY